VRVVSGRFEKGMKVKVARTGRVVTLARPSQMFAQSRATVQEGFAGAACRVHEDSRAGSHKGFSIKVDPAGFLLGQPPRVTPF
jgi:peptide subunit release factor RF-3